MSKQVDQSTKVNELSVGDLKNLMKETIQETNVEIIESVTILSTQVNLLLEKNKELQEEMEKLRADRERDHRTITMLEDQIKRKNIIIKGLDSENNLRDAVKKVCRDNLKIQSSVSIKSVKRLSNWNGKMSVVAELDSEEAVQDLFKNTRNLAGTTISVERDLNMVKKEQKKVMLQLKRELLSINRNHRISVRDEKIRINENLLIWNKSKELVCGQRNGIDVLCEIYGEAVNKLNLSYNELLIKVK